MPSFAATLFCTADDDTNNNIKVSILLAIMPQHASVVGMLSIAITGFGTLWPSPVAVPILVSI